VAAAKLAGCGFPTHIAPREPLCSLVIPSIAPPRQICTLRWIILNRREGRKFCQKLVSMIAAFPAPAV